jgi:hypothetical protein
LVYFTAIGIFYGHLVYFTAIGIFYRYFGLFYGHLVYFTAIWYILLYIWYILWSFGIFFHVLVRCTKRNLSNPWCHPSLSFFCMSHSKNWESHVALASRGLPMSHGKPWNATCGFFFSETRPFVDVRITDQQNIDIEIADHQKL